MLPYDMSRAFRDLIVDHLDQVFRSEQSQFYKSSLAYDARHPGQLTLTLKDGTAWHVEVVVTPSRAARA